MNDLGAAKVFIGIEIERNRANRIITLKQTRYIESTLQELGMADCNGISTPLDTTAKLWPKEAIKQRDNGQWQEKVADVKQ